MLMSYLREIWHFKAKKLLHQGIVNGSIANFLQYCYSKILKIELYCSQYCKKIYIYILLLLFPPKFLSHPFHFFCSLLSLSSLFLHMLSPFWSYIAEISHPSHTTSLSSLIARLLPHCTDVGFWIFEVRGWISMDQRTGFGSLGWDW